MACKAIDRRAQGGRGERLAAAWLERAGYRILATNQHSRYGEVDLIAEGEGCICFVEVKTRRRGGMVSGEAAVGPSKRQKIIRTALLWLQDHPSALQPRFDVICLELDVHREPVGFDHYKGAFDGDGL